MSYLINNKKEFEEQVIEDYMENLLSNGGILKFDSGELYFSTDGYFVTENECGKIISKCQTFRRAIKYHL